MAGSKRHHYIPQFLMRNFSPTRDEQNPPIWRLDKATGRISKSVVGNEAVIGYFNRLMEVDAPDVETSLAQIESACKPSIDKVIRGEDLSELDGEFIGLFSVLQDKRTPRSRQQSAELMEHMFRIEAEIGLFKGQGTRDALRRRLGHEPSDEEIIGARDKLLADLRAGRLVPQASADHEVLSTFFEAEPLAKEIVAKMRVACLHATSREFVIADHPVCMFDPIVPADRGVGWMSSPLTEVTFPVAKDTCLLFQQGSPGYAHSEAPPELVADINLRSYAFAEWAVYGSGQRWLQDVRTAARSNRTRVTSYQPRKRHLIFFESQEGKAQPHGVQVIEPIEKPVRGFRPKDRPTRRPPQMRPVDERLLQEWTHLTKELPPEQ